MKLSAYCGVCLWFCDILWLIWDHYTVIRLNPNDAWIHFNMANLMDELGNFDQSKLHYETCLKLNKKYSEAYHNYAVLLHKHKKYKQSKKYYKLSLKYEFESSLTHRNYALLLTTGFKDNENISGNTNNINAINTTNIVSNIRNVGMYHNNNNHRFFHQMDNNNNNQEFDLAMKHFNLAINYCFNQYYDHDVHATNLRNIALQQMSNDENREINNSDNFNQIKQPKLKSCSTAKVKIIKDVFEMIKGVMVVNIVKYILVLLNFNVVSLRKIYIFIINLCILFCTESNAKCDRGKKVNIVIMTEI